MNRSTFLHRGLYIALAGGLLFLTLRQFRQPPQSLPLLGTLPNFSLTNQSGQSVTERSFQGRWTVANFIFLRCKKACPRLTARMKTLQDRCVEWERTERRVLPLHLVSFSLDPEHDTPPALDAYARSWNADPQRWSFLTGTTDQIQKAVTTGFKIGYAKTQPGTDFDILHGNYSVLVDPAGHIRNYYSTETEEEASLFFEGVLNIVAGS